MKASETLQIDDRSARNLGKMFIVIYLAILGVFCVTYNVFPGPEFVVVCFFIYAIYRKWTRRFLRDWVPFVALFLAYEAMYGIADNVSGVVHARELMNAELKMFGTIPTLMLQRFYRSPVLDYFGAFFYSLHFIIPTVFGFILWKYSHENYRKFTFAFLVCTYSALITFLVYPSAPPWFGVKFHAMNVKSMLPGLKVYPSASPWFKVKVERILFQIDHNLGVPIYATIFELIQPNPFAAFPSLHATYPWLISLYAIKIKRIKALPILLIPIGVWFSAVYLGEHYIIDLLGGVAYATFAFILVEKIIPRLPDFPLKRLRGHWF